MCLCCDYQKKAYMDLRSTALMSTEGKDEEGNDIQIALDLNDKNELFLLMWSSEGKELMLKKTINYCPICGRSLSK